MPKISNLDPLPATISPSDKLVVLDDSGNQTHNVTVENLLGDSLSTLSTKDVPDGELVGSTDAQTLTNKTIDFNSNTITNLPAGSGGDVTLAGVQTLTNKTMAYADNTFTGFPTGEVTLDTAQTLTNKTLDYLANTFLNFPAGGSGGSVPFYDTVDGLVGVTPSGNTVAACGGKGGGIFYWGSSIAKTEHNGATHISPTVPLTGASAADYLDGLGDTDSAGTGVWVRIRPLQVWRSEWFRTVADGTTDNQAVLQRLLNAGAGEKIFFEGGHLYHINQLNVAGDHTQVVLNPGCILETGVEGSARSLMFTDLIGASLIGYGAEIRASRLGLNTNTLYILGCDHMVVEGILFDGSGKDNIYLGKSNVRGPNTHTIIRNCHIRNGMRQGISLISAIDTLIEGCVIHDISGLPPAAGIDVEGNKGDIVRNTTISNCHIYNCNDQGAIIVIYGWNTIITGCQINNCLFGINIDSGGTAFEYHDITAVDATTDTFTVQSTSAIGLAEYTEVRFQALNGATIPGGLTSTSARYRARNVTATTFQIATDVVTTVVNLTDAGTWAAGDLRVGVSDFSISGNTYVTDTRIYDVNGGVYGENTGSITVRNCEIHNDPVDPTDLLASGVNMINVDDVTVEGCRIVQRPLSASGNRGVYIVGLRPRVIDTYLEGIPEAGLELIGCRDIYVDGVIVRDCGTENGRSAFLKNINGGVVRNLKISNPNSAVRYGFLVDSGVSNVRNVTIDDVDGYGCATDPLSNEMSTTLRTAAQDPTVTWGNVILNSGRAVRGAYADGNLTAATIAAGATGSFTVSNVFGARAGDEVSLRWAGPLGGLQTWGEVTADNVVTIYFANPTANALASVDVDVLVMAERANRPSVSPSVIPIPLPTPSNPTPADIFGADLWSWVNADNVVLDGSSKVQTLTDLGPNGNDFTQTDPALRWDLTTLVDGNSAIQKGAVTTGGYLCAAPSGVAPSDARGSTVFIVLNRTSEVKWLYGIGDSAGTISSGPNLLSATGTPTKLIARFVGTPGQNLDAVAPSGIDLTIEHTLAAGAGSHNTVVNFGADNITALLAASGAYDRIVLGNRNALDNQISAASFAEFIVVNREATPAEVADIQAYIEDKYTLGVI